MILPNTQNRLRITWAYNLCCFKYISTTIEFAFAIIIPTPILVIVLIIKKPSNVLQPEDAKANTKPINIPKFTVNFLPTLSPKYPPIKLPIRIPTNIDYVIRIFSVWLRFHSLLINGNIIVISTISIPSNYTAKNIPMLFKIWYFPNYILFSNIYS